MGNAPGDAGDRRCQRSDHVGDALLTWPTLRLCARVHRRARDRCHAGLGAAVWDSAKPLLSDRARRPPTPANDNPVWQNTAVEVVPGLYQIRGMDLSNMSLIEGSRGVVVIDRLICALSWSDLRPTETNPASLKQSRRHTRRWADNRG